MKAPSVNMLIIALVIALGGYTIWQRLHPKPVKYDSCYPEKGVAKTQKKDDRELDAALMMLMGDPGRISDMLLLALTKDVPARFADPLRRFHARSFDDIFSPDDAARQDIRELLFVWANVADVKFDTRGPFIDARELAFLERLTRKPFLQIHRYPNPAPMAAAGLREGFRLMLDYVYAEFAAHSAGKELFDFRAPGGSLLSVAALDRIKAKAATLDDAGRLRLWQNVLRAIPHDIAKGLSPADHSRLDAAIAAALPGMNEKKVADTMPVDTKNVFTDRDNRPIAFNIIFAYDMNSRTVCYLYVNK